MELSAVDSGRAPPSNSSNNSNRLWFDLIFNKAPQYVFLRIHHGRKFQRYPGRMYVSGRVDIFDMIDIDLFTVVALNMMVLKLGYTGFADVAGSGVDSSGLSHDESFGVDDLDLNLNEPVNLNVSQVETQSELPMSEEPDVGPTQEPILAEVSTQEPIVAEVSTQEPIVAEVSTKAPIVEEVGTQEFSVEDVVIEDYVNSGKIGKNAEHKRVICMDLPFDNTGITNLVPDDVLEGEDMDVINADGFGSDHGNDEERNYRKRMLAELRTEMKGIINTSGQWKDLFYTGQKFNTPKEAKDRVYLHSIESRRNLKLYKNDGVRIRARCEGKVPVFTMSQDAHDKGDLCPWVLEIKHCTYKFLSEKIFEQVRVNPDIPVKAIQDQLQHELEVQISMSKAFRVKAKAEREIRGDHIAVERNTDPSLPTRVFQRIYVCLGALKLGFRACRRDLLGLDGAFMKAHFRPSRAKFDLLLNNFCEVFNGKIVRGRDKPLIILLEYIREYCIKRIVNVQGVIDKCTGPLTPTATRIMESIKKEDYLMKMRWNGANKYQVSRKWELIGIPCKHDVAACWNMVVNDRAAPPPETWVNPCYWLSTWKETYSYKIQPICRTNYWEKSICPTTLLPHKHHVQVGRPKKKRKRSKHEDEPFVKDGKLSRKGRTITCQSCENTGHNKATCKGQGRKATTEAIGSASRQAQQIEPAVGQDGSGRSGVAKQEDVFRWGTIRDQLLIGDEKGAQQLRPERARVYSDLSPEDKDRYNAKIRATNILLQGLPKDIYTLINHYTEAKDIWDNVNKLLEGSELTKEDRESQLYDDFEHFCQNKRETIHDYYVRFSKLINDMRNIKMTMSRMQLNSKFVNNMLPEWGRFVTAMKLNSGLRDSNYDQLYAYLKQHETHANENKMMLDRFTQHTVNPLALMSNVSQQQYYSQSSTTPPFTHLQPHFADNTQLDSGLSPTDNLIEKLTNTLALLTKSYKTYLPQTNNQLRTSSNTRNQATVQDGRVVVQNVQGRQNRGQGNNARGAGAAGYGGTQSRVGNVNPGQARQIKCYNCNSIGHIARNCTQLKRLQNLEYFKDKMLPMQAQENRVALDEDTDDCDAFDSDVDEAPAAQTMFMANLSSADPVYDEAGPSYDSNILSEYAKDNAVPVVQSNVSFVPNDAYMIILNDIYEPSAQYVFMTTQNNVVDNSLTAELETYKEQVELKFEKKENKYLEEFLDMKALKEKVEDKLYKQDHSLQTVHMLCKPKPYYNEQNKVAIGYKNPLCLTRAKKVQPALYNGHEIIKTNHVPAIVHNLEDTLEIAEITRKKMNDKMKDPECVKNKVKIAPHDYSKENYLATFTPQKQLTPERIFWSKDLIKMKAEALKEQTTAS
ncbi:retrovirus-related pol polyprotein from transposon TNT 1-94 [Tanacetum coccineum]